MDVWEQRYQQGATGWDRGKSSPQLERWLNNEQLKPCKILVPGCGNGYEVVTLARAGFSVTAVDIAETPIRNLGKLLANERLEVELIHADILKYQPAQLFDAVYEQTCLCALHPDLLQAYEQILYSVLNSAGSLYALFMQTHKEGGPPYHCDIADMQRLFDPSRWSWVGENPLKVEHPSGIYELPQVLHRQSH